MHSKSLNEGSLVGKQWMHNISLFKPNQCNNACKIIIVFLHRKTFLVHNILPHFFIIIISLSFRVHLIVILGSVYIISNTWKVNS